MVFSSPVFLFLFLPISVILYYLSPRLTGKNIWLTVVSLFFYAWGEPFFVLVMLASISINYVLGILMGRTDRVGARRLLLTLSLVISLGLLAVFKYTDFLIVNLNALLGLQMAPPHLTLPLGISFFTFQELSYTIDVYRRKTEPQKNFAWLLLYISLFPQLVAGPIVRYETIQRQLTGRTHSWTKTGEGCRRFLMGLAKKVLLANQLAVVADEVFDKVHGVPPALTVWLGVLAYALQIFFDFSGYSDMAIGLGKIFGFDFEENFSLPYIARSAAEFWRRWHISLGTWFRDYLYFPLGGSRGSTGKTLRNLLIVWFLTGLWHGAAWNFIAWGLYFGVLIALERFVWGGWLKRHRVLSHVYLGLVALLGWVLFRANGLADAATVYRSMFGLLGNGLIDYRTALYLNDIWPVLVLAILMATPLPRLWGDRLRHTFHRAYPISRSLFYTACYGMSVLYLVNSTYNPFIYFRF